MPSPTSVNRRTLLSLLGGSIAAPFVAPHIALAQGAWPTRPVRYVNGFPAGGATDSLSRILCQKMSELSGQSFVVENRAGAGGVLGADAVAKAAPDGYTVGLGGIASNVLAIGSYAKLPYDPVRDFTFISGMWQLPNILVAKKDLFSSDLKELLAAFKKEPRKYSYASAGFGTTLHLSGEMMNSMAGVEVVHIPYKGAGPALNDLLGGRVDMLFDNLPGSLPSVRAGLIKPIAVTSRTRIPELPDVPAMAEVLPGYAMTSWTAMIGPANMPAELVAQVNALTAKALADPMVKTRYGDLGASPWPTTPPKLRHSGTASRRASSRSCRRPGSSRSDIGRAAGTIAPADGGRMTLRRIRSARLKKARRNAGLFVVDIAGPGATSCPLRRTCSSGRRARCGRRFRTGCCSRCHRRHRRERRQRSPSHP